MLAMWMGHFDEWALAEKVRFDKDNRLIIVVPGTTDLSIKIDVYSAWKRWAVSHPDNTAVPAAMRAIGGDPTIGGQQAGDIYFMQNGWRLMLATSQTRVDGVLFSDDFDTPYQTYKGTPQYATQASSLVTTVATGGAVDEAAIAGAVRTGIRPDLTVINEGVKDASILVPHTENLPGN